MTRRRIIAGVILLAAMAVVLLGGWRRVAYREKAVGAFVVCAKRWEWLPGPELYVPDQVCRHCEGRRHEYCFRINNAIPMLRPEERLIFRNLGVDRDLLHRYPPNFRCTCTDPSHDGDSE